MEPTLAEEIRALLEVYEKACAEKYPLALILADAHLAKAFPALAAKMLAVIDERNGLQMAIEEMGEVHDCITTRMNTRIIALEKELAHLRWEAECLQVEAK